jgi:hypothetical protein
MSDIIITWPKRRALESYLEELKKAWLAGRVIGYRVASRPNVEEGDRCYVVHSGKLRGWNEIFAVEYRGDVIDPLTHKPMRPGYYIIRDAEWHPCPEPLKEMVGFRGYRYSTLALDELAEAAVKLHEARASGPRESPG